MIQPVDRAFFSVFGKYRAQQVHFYSSISSAKMSSQNKWKVEKNKMLNMPLEERRKLYKTADFIKLDRVDPWCKFVVRNRDIEMLKHTLDDVNEFQKMNIDPSKDKELSEKVSIFQGDITKLEIDAIVNAANARLIAGGGVDGAIHRAAGPFLQEECNSLHGCTTGDAKVTGGYNLPAKYVIHTVGPRDGSVKDLQSCYDKSLSFHHELNVNSIAFPCIATGIYGFPNRLAAHTALRTARKFLEANSEMERIIFCTFMPVDVDIYKTLMQMYFPVQSRNYNDGASSSE